MATFRAYAAPRGGAGHRRHRKILSPALFVMLVLLPIAAIAGYLYYIATDQYSSEAAFSIRSEQGGGVSQGILGIVTSIGGTGSAQDTDLLYDYIRSQAIVEEVDKKLDLHKIWAQRGEDRLLSLPADAPIEEMVRYWKRMVTVSNESRNGTLRIEVRAFTPEDAQRILMEILSASSHLINQLSTEAREDTLRLSSELVTETRDQLQDIRLKLTDFRRTNQIVTPELEAQTRSGLIATLQGRIADAQVERDSILAYANPNDPRIQNIDNRIASLRSQLEQERDSLLQSGKESAVDVFGVYEGLLVDQELMNTAYGQALAAQAMAHTEARRQARYVAVHIPPSLAQTPLYPRRLRLVLVSALLLTLLWSIATLFYQNARDRH